MTTIGFVGPGAMGSRIGDSDGILAGLAVGKVFVDMSTRPWPGARR